MTIRSVNRTKQGVPPLRPVSRLRGAIGALALVAPLAACAADVPTSAQSQSPPVALVTVTPAAVSAVPGGKVQFTAVVTDADRNVISGAAVTWSSTNQSSATVDANGLVTAVAEGSANITATSEGQSGSATVTVTTSVGDLQVNTSTTGSNLDPDGYTVTVDGSQNLAIGINDQVTFSGLAAGSHSVRLTGVSTSCTVSGANPATVTVTTGGTAQITFNVSCSDTPPPTGGVLVLKDGQSQVGGSFKQICVGSCGGLGASDVFVSGVEINGSTLPAWPIGNNGLFYVQGGPVSDNHNIRIENSVIHDTPNWQTSQDTEHHGCITIKSGDGPMWIVGNEIYHCTAVFYFKYDWPGPIYIEDNYIHDSRTGNRIRASRVEFRNNVIVGTAPMLEEKSFDGVLDGNTLVNATFGWSRDNGHVSRNNVIFGDEYLTYNSGGSTQYTQSVSEDNCFIGPSNMLAVSRLGQGLTIAQWKAQGHDLNSPHLVETDKYKVFADPDNGDYTLIGEAAQVCAGKGAQ